MNFNESVSYAFSDLSNREGSTAVIGVTVFFAALSVLLLGYFGLGIQAHLHGSVDSSSLTRVVVDSPPGAGPEARFSAGTLDKIESLPGVVDAWARMEVGVDLIVGDNRQSGVIAEGTHLEDPLADPNSMVWGDGFRGEEAHEVVLSKSRFLRAGGELSPGGPNPGHLILQVRREVGEALENSDISMEIVGVIDDGHLDAAAASKVYIPNPVAVELDHWCTGKRSILPWNRLEAEGERRFDGASIYVPKSSLRLLEPDMESLRVEATRREDVEVVKFKNGAWLGLFGPPGDLSYPSWASAETQGGRRVWEITHAVDSHPLKIVCMEPDDPRWTEQPAGKSVYLGARSSAPITYSPLPGTRLVNRSGASDVGGDLHALVDTVASSLFRLEHLNLAKRERLDVFLTSPARYKTLESEADQADWQVVPLTPVSERLLIRHTVRDRQAEDGTISGHLLDNLRAARASVEVVVPHRSIAAKVGVQRQEVLASSPRDPAAFSAGLIEGSWLDGGEGRPIVLSKSAVSSVFPGRDWQECVGETVPILLERGYGESLELPCELVGVTPSDHGFMMLDDLLEAEDWLASRLDYSESEGVFVDPMRQAEAMGTMRATVITEDIEGLRELIARMTPLDYRVHHRLGELERTASLGNTIVLLALALAASAILAALMTSWSTTTLHMHAKRREIGILRALGLEPWHAAGVFALQGLLVGSLAFLVAVICASLAEPDLSAAMAAAMGFELGVILPDRLWSVGSLPVHLIGWGASVGLCIVGSFLAAWRATNVSLARALRIAE